MDLKDPPTIQDCKQLSSQARITSFAGNILSDIWNQSPEFVKWSVETMNGFRQMICPFRYIDQLNAKKDQILHILDQRAEFLRVHVQFLPRRICTTGNIPSDIWNQSSEFVKWPMETVNGFRQTIWPFRYIGKLQRQIDQLRAEKEEQKKEIMQLQFSAARRYRVDVILDPNTAHPRLEVSQDGKCVRDTGNVLRVLNNEERFDSHLFVLAKKGFSKGQHYWEVEVGQKRSWNVGLASESVSRKGRITLSPQNGYWVIGLDGNKKYWAQTDPWTQLNVSGKPTKIGMFLDMLAGTLSFYDVNGKCKLHSFIVKHSGKLYPFFSTGSLTESLDSQSLKILPLLEEEEIERIISGINNVYSI